MSKGNLYFYFIGITIFVNFILCVWTFHPYNDYEDQLAEESIQIVRPITFGASVQSEVNRLQASNDVFPPQDLSYFIPYGDRTIAAFQFPCVSKNQLAQVTQEYLQKQQQEQQGNPTSNANNVNSNGNPLPKYYAPQQQQQQNSQQGQSSSSKAPKKQIADIGLVISQNYIYRQNVRDFSNLSKLNQNRPSDQILFELATAFGERHQHINPYYKTGYGNKYRNSKRSHATPSFVIVSLESRMKSSDNSDQLFGFTNTLTNGTIIFPTPNNPSLMTSIPFVLRHMVDVDNILDEHQLNSQGLIPEDKTQIMSFLKLLHDLHKDNYEEGKLSIGRLRKASEKLEQPSPPQGDSSSSSGGYVDNNFLNYNDPSQSDNRENSYDELAYAEAIASKTHWLYTSTVGIRSVTHLPDEDFDFNVNNENYYSYGPPPQSQSYYSNQQFQHFTSSPPPPTQFPDLTSSQPPPTSSFLFQSAQASSINPNAQFNFQSTQTPPLASPPTSQATPTQIAQPPQSEASREYLPPPPLTQFQYNNQTPHNTFKSSKSFFQVQPTQIISQAPGAYGSPSNPIKIITGNEHFFLRPPPRP